MGLPLDIEFCFSQVSIRMFWIYFLFFTLHLGFIFAWCLCSSFAFVRRLIKILLTYLLVQWCWGHGRWTMTMIMVMIKLLLFSDNFSKKFKHCYIFQVFWITESSEIKFMVLEKSTVCNWNAEEEWIWDLFILIIHTVRFTCKASSMTASSSYHPRGLDRYWSRSFFWPHPLADATHPLGWDVCNETPSRNV